MSASHPPPSFRITIVPSPSSSSSNFVARSRRGRFRQHLPQLLAFAVYDGTSSSRHYTATSRRHPSSLISVSRQHHDAAAVMMSYSSNSNNNGEKQSVEDEDDEEDNTNNNNIMNGLYLDQGTYLQAEDAILRSDGSLDLNRWGRREWPQAAMGGEIPTSTTPSSRLKKKTNAYQIAVEGLFSPPPIYSYYSDGDDTGDGMNNETKSSQTLSDEERFYQAVLEIENGRGDGGSINAEVIDPEALHRQVFAEEQAYFQQSEDFRKALSSLFSDNATESPMAKERRERIEQYNEKVLCDLMNEIDEMESLAVSREDAIMGTAEQESSEGMGGTTTTARLGKSPVSCSKCGLRVTPDMIQRAALMNQRLAKESREILCSACHGQRFVTKEAELRVPALDSFASPRMFDNKKSTTRMSSRNDQFYASGRGWNADRRRGNGKESRDSNIQGISTASLFDVSGGTQSSQKIVAEDDIAMKNEPIVDAISKSTSSSLSPTNAKTSSSGDRQQRFLRRPSSRILGGAELMKRMQQRESESPPRGDEENLIILSGSSTGELSFKAQASERIPLGTDRGIEQRKKVVVKREVEGLVDFDPSSSDDDGGGDAVSSALVANTDNNEQSNGAHGDSTINPWVKVEDPSTKRSLYWNTETGEMKRSD